MPLWEEGKEWAGSHLDVDRLLLGAHQDVEVDIILGVVKVNVGVHIPCGKGSSVPSWVQLLRSSYWQCRFAMAIEFVVAI